MSLSVVQRIKSLSIPFLLPLLQFSLPKSKEDDLLYYNKDGLFQEYSLQDRPVGRGTAAH